jgi:hypothetical protein
MDMKKALDDMERKSGMRETLKNTDTEKSAKKKNR